MASTIKISALAAAAGVMALSAPASAAPSFDMARSFGTANGIEQVAQHSSRYRHSHEDYRRGYRGQQVYYGEPVSRSTRVWRGRDGRTYCRRKDGTTGLIIGGAVGALLGREIDGGRDRTLGTILGAAGGALLGREVDRGGSRCR